ncbi:MAG: putative Ig domain-containing protein [Patescibacteria group bacterium]
MFFSPLWVSARTFSFSPPTRGEITAAIRAASEKTGVRSAVLYGLLGQETGYGRNVGKTAAEWSALCVGSQGPDCRRWQRYDCKATYNNARHFDDILREIGFIDAGGKADRSKIPTSSTCALGLTQFEPNTWWSTLASRKDRAFDPWNVADAALATAYHLRDSGADSSDVLASGEVIGAKDRIALQKYYCGSYYAHAECVAYASGVEQKARRAETDLLRFDLEQQIRRLRSIPPPAASPELPAEGEARQRRQRGEPSAGILAEVRIVAPATDAIESSPVLIRATVSGPADISRVVFTVDADRGGGRIDATDRDAPFEATMALEPGPHTISAEAYDSAERRYRSGERRFTVSGIVERSAPRTSARIEPSAPPAVLPRTETQKIADPVPVNLSGGIAGKPYEAALTLPQSSAVIERWEIVIGAGNVFPSGFALDPKSGKISGTPQESGIWIFNAYAAEADGNRHVALFRVEIEEALIITTASLPGGKIGKPYAATLAASVAGKPPYRWEINDGVRFFPPGLTLDPATGIVSGVPSAEGAWPFTVILTDARENRATKELSISISPAIAITTEKLPEAFVGQSYRATIRGQSDAAPIVWSVLRANETFPPGFELDPRTGVIFGTPATLGAWTFSVEAVDSAGDKVQKTLTIAVVQPFTIATETLAPGVVGSPYMIEFAAENGTPPYIWKMIDGLLPHGFLFEPDPGLLSGLPDSAGVSSFTMEVEDQEKRRASRSFTLEIREPSTPAATGTPATRAPSLWRSTAAGIFDAFRDLWRLLRGK